jgi:hypothetical protein
MEKLIISSGVTFKKLHSAWSTSTCKLVILMLLQIFTVFTLRAQVQDISLPEAEDLFINFVEKTGGQQAYDMIRNRLTKSKMVMSSMGITGEVTSYLAKPGLYHISIDSTMIGKLEYGSDGKTVWDINPILGPKVREGIDRLRFRCLYTLDLPAQWRTAFKKIECTGVDTIEGRPAYKVTAVNHEDYSMIYYFDKDSGLIVKMIFPLETLAGPSDMEIFYGDYKITDGILYPHIQKSLEQERDITRTVFSVKHNVDIPENTFVLPDVIKKIAGTVK